MPVDPVGQPGRTDPVRETGSASGPRGPGRPASGSDQADISGEAESRLEVHELVSAVRVAAQALPDVREDKVLKARQRISQGYYNRSEVHGTLVDTLLRSFQPFEES
jgi:hypothetical protein